MLAEALTALAAAGGTAVAKAAGTDLWKGLRDQVARWFGRGDAQREQRELERLDRSAAELEAAAPIELERVRARQEIAWQTRIETLLEELDDEQREQAAAELRALLEQAAPQPGGTNVLSGNTFHGQTAVQIGDHNRQDVRFGPQP
ncbi:hypothetical protein [Streptacidiphilus jiangxiensis]|uniref:Uncharacterized protein n=1 Tax=Streptacidiphilus jiangxiensis TaxID=235985 RepID=A0A1H7NYY5_STRJI|nr:hypothetical protein [Streptacidiphilus jiangxiensis]SEL28751.1 hypothetical protein SAMN05414137_107140 [Streptacidiphilus jiangxiensis]